MSSGWLRGRGIERCGPAIEHPAIDDGGNFHTDTVVVSSTRSTALTFGGPAHIWAYFIDTQCEDNAGHSVLQYTLR